MMCAVRELELDDIAAVQHIDAVVHGQHWSDRTFVDQVHASDRQHVVATENDTIVAHGALWFDGQRARITNVAVAADRQGRGLGKVIVSHLCHAASQHHSARELTLEVAPTNLAAQALYRKFGFAPVGIDRSFYGPGNDALVMSVLDLADPAWLVRLSHVAGPWSPTAKGAVA